jgi:tetratricopeptide (TPR) repeat protein
MAAEGYFPDAQLYIDLKGTSRQPVSPAAALETLLTALLGADPGRPDDLETLAHLWRSALQGKRALLVLDNAANAAQVRPLLPANPTCTVLVTSRQRFGLSGAKLLDLTRLSTEDGRALLRTLAPHLDDASADAIAERCGGLPLAIRIAGNHLALNNDFPPQEYATLLADERGRLVHLSDPSDPDLDVAATLSLSIAQLEVGNRWAWTMLGLFPAPFDADAAGALWGEGVSQDTWAALDEETTVEWLRTLRNRSLVSFDPDTRRYRLHDLLYLAAQQEMENSAGVSRARARLAYHFLDVARRVDRRQQYLDLDADWPHLRAALICAQENDGQLLSELVLALDNYWSARGMARERAEWNQLAAQASADLGLREVAGRHLTNQGRAYTDRGDARQAIEVYGQALTISRGNGNQLLEGTLLGSLGQAYLALGDARRASHYHEQALEIARAIGDRQGEGSSYGDLGQAYVALGDARRAIECFQRALVIAREIGDRRLEGTHLGNLGLAHSALGEARQAVAWQKQALSIHRQTGDRRGEAYALDSLGQAFIDLGQPERAADYYEQALEISRTIGDRRAEGSDLGSLGQVHAHLGDVRRAIDFHRQALRIAKETGDRRSQGASLGNLGRAYLELGHPAEAMEAYEQALKIARYIGDRRSEATWLGELGEAHAQLGQVTQAVKYHEQALTLYQEIGDRRGEGNHLSSLGLLARQQGDDDRAHDTLLAALKTFEAIKDPSAGRVWQWLTELEGQPN